MGSGYYVDAAHPSNMGARTADEVAREIVKLIKNSKKKAQASIQTDVVRVSSKDRDTLQEIIALVKQQDFGIDLQFTNYR